MGCGSNSLRRDVISMALANDLCIIFSFDSHRSKELARPSGKSIHRYWRTLDPSGTADVHIARLHIGNDRDVNTDRYQNPDQVMNPDDLPRLL